ncbi:hypothetical protein GCM10008967_00410 [Bacillus carboniphilus]|uniref:LamG-like jellyroll fold domain-containing protein n=1 Tax=Bacillus carboniphilus TaxID=86663 RepID=A0ABN0VPA0_9BACI
MQPLARGGYTEQEVKDALHGKYAPRRIRFRYDLLDKEDKFIKTLDTVESGEVSMASLASIKRTARFKMKDDGEINWLSDRIQPFVELKIPEIKRKYDDYALEFDGISNNVRVLDNAVLNNHKNKITVVARIKPTLAGNSTQIVADKWNSTAPFGYTLRILNNSQLNVWIGNTSHNNGLTTNNANLAPNEWVTIAFTYDGSILNIFKNGILLASQTTSVGIGGVGADLYFAKRGAGGDYYYQGQIDYVHVWNKNLSQKELQDYTNKYLKGDEPSLEGLWRFNEGTGTIAYDSTSNGNNGTIYGAKWKKNGNEIETIPSSWINFPLGIFLLNSPTRSDQNNNVYRDVEAYGLTQILRDDKFLERYTVTAGTNYRDAVIEILASAGITKHNIEETDKVLPTDKDWAPGVEKLKAVNELLSAINFNTIIDDPNGYFTSSTYRSPSVRSAEYTYQDDDLSVTFPGMTEELDTFGVFNSWIVVLSDPEREPLVSKYTNDNPDSPTSTISRGRIIVDAREVDNIADQQALDAYVQRIAFEASQVYGKVEFDTAIMPMHDYNDIVQLNYSKLGISGKYAETGWTIPLRAGGKMRHSLRRVVTI